MTASPTTSKKLVLERRTGWQALDLREMWQYRELLYFFVWRDIKIRYRQTAMGIAWAFIQPLAAMIIFTFLFNKMAGIESGTEAPYQLFVYSGLIAWTFFANAVSTSSGSLLSSKQMISKIYFPRTLIPIGAIGALVLDMVIGIVLLLPLYVWFGWHVSVHILALPLFVLATFMAASGLGLALAALSVRFRDIKYAIPYAVQMGMFLTPLFYPVEMVDRFPLARNLMGLNPMAGMVEGFRFCLLGESPDWALIGVSLAVSLVLFVGGLLFFRRWEVDFADII